MRSLIVLRQLEPKLRLGYSVPRLRKDPTQMWLTKLPAYAAAAWLRMKLPSAIKVHMAAGRCDALMCHWRLVSPRLVKAVNEAGGELYVWTVDDGRAHRPAREARRHRGHHQRPAPLRSSLPAHRCGRVAGRVGARARPVARLGDDLGGAWQLVALAPAEAHDAAQRHALDGLAKLNVHPDSAGTPFAVPSTRQPESASLTSAHVSSSTLYCTRKRIESRTPFGVPGIEARMPIVSGCLAVSHTLTVAHGVGFAAGAADGASRQRER